MKLVLSYLSMKIALILSLVLGDPSSTAPRWLWLLQGGSSHHNYLWALTHNWHLQSQFQSPPPNVVRKAEDTIQWCTRLHSLLSLTLHSNLCYRDEETEAWINWMKVRQLVSRGVGFQNIVTSGIYLTDSQFKWCYVNHPFIRRRSASVQYWVPGT